MRSVLNKGFDGALYGDPVMVRMAFFCSTVSLCRCLVGAACHKVMPYVRWDEMSAW